MPIFTLYCDDSGTHNASDVAIAACYIATVEQWQEVKRNWAEINAKENFGIFHMADFVARREQFAVPEWQDQAKRNRTLEKLINIITTRVAFGIGAVVIKSAYDNIIPKNMRRRFGNNHYTFAIRMCVAFLEKWRARNGYMEPMQYVFDRLTKGKGDIDDALGIAASGGDDAIRRYGIYKDGWSFQDKSIVTQLQTADIWAYENYRYAVDRFFPPVEKRKALRQSYKVLRSKVPCVVRYMNENSLLDLVAKVGEKDSLTEGIVLTHDESGGV